MSLLFASLLLGVALASPSGGVPTLDAESVAIADAVRMMADTDPVSRVAMLLEARRLPRNALFSLATSHPGIVEQLIKPEFAEVLEYLEAIPAPELHRIRRGETVVRADRDLKGRERDIAIKVARRMNFPKFDPEKVQAVRLSPLEGRVFLMEITYKKSKRKEYTQNISIAWPSSPERDEESRSALAVYFGARPSADCQAVGAPIPINDGSFEREYTLNDAWELVDAVELGNKRTPVNEVSIDDSIALDGYHSVRFHADDHTRLFKEVVQVVPITGGQAVRVRTQMRAEDLRVEFQQREDQVCLTVSWLDMNRQPVGGAVKAVARLATHPWELVEVAETAPYNAAFLRIGLLSAVSGTAWFDAVEVRRD
jgi:hypothetical protein